MLGNIRGAVMLSLGLCPYCGNLLKKVSPEGATYITYQCPCCEAAFSA